MTKATPAVAVVMCALAASLFPASVAHSTVATASKQRPAERKEPMIGKIIVKPRSAKIGAHAEMLGVTRVTQLTNRAGIELRAHRVMSTGATVMKLAAPVPLGEARAIAARIAADPDVQYAEPSMPMRISAVPTDPSYALRQWHLFASNTVFADTGTNLGSPPRNYTTVGGLNGPGAWNFTIGVPTVVVAVIDNGVTLNHPEISAALLPGYDMVAANAGGAPTNFVANDGNGRDPDPTDPGDWIEAAEKTNPATAAFCDDGTPGLTTSSWHGTHMTGAIVGQWGNSGNGTSTAGIAPGVRVVPVRALGKCGGDTADVADAMVWAAGLTVPGAPANSNPARIISMSLGGVGACSQTYRDALVQVSGFALVIAASGNGGAQPDPANPALPAVDEPANCTGVLAVTAHTVNGDNATYANVGPEVALSSPGGGDPQQLLAGSAVDTDNAWWTWSSALRGLRGPASTDAGGLSGPATVGFTGTSGATAQVSGVAALVLSVNPALTPAQLRSVLVNTARPHPAGGYCANVVATLGTVWCGSGLIDAGAAVAAAAPAQGGGSGGGALPLAQLLLLGLLGLFARQRRV